MLIIVLIIMSGPLSGCGSSGRRLDEGAAAPVTIIRIVTIVMIIAMIQIVIVIVIVIELVIVIVIKLVIDEGAVAPGRERHWGPHKPTPPPQIRFKINSINLNCSEQAQFCACLVSFYIQ